MEYPTAAVISEWVGGGGGGSAPYNKGHVHITLHI